MARVVTNADIKDEAKELVCKRYPNSTIDRVFINEYLGSNEKDVLEICKIHNYD